MKLNTDEEQSLASQFQIRGIPAVKLFRDGKVVAEFVGAQPAGRRARVPETAPGVGGRRSGRSRPRAAGAGARRRGLRVAARGSPRRPTTNRSSSSLAARWRCRAMRQGAEPSPTDCHRRPGRPPVIAVRALAHFARIVSSPDETDAIQSARVTAGPRAAARRPAGRLDALVAAMQRNRRYAAGQGRRISCRPLRLRLRITRASPPRAAASPRCCTDRNERAGPHAGRASRRAPGARLNSRLRFAAGPPRRRRGSALIAFRAR